MNEDTREGSTDTPNATPQEITQATPDVAAPSITTATNPTSIETAVAHSADGMKFALIALAAVVVALFGYLFVTDNAILKSIPGLSSIRGESEAVAIVNGEKITREELDDSILSLSERVTLQGGDPTTAEIKAAIEKQSIDTLINTALLRSAAASAGFEANAEEIQAEYDGIVANFGSEEALKEQMAALSITKTDVTEDITDQITVTKYLESRIPPTAIGITEEEITAFYEGIELPEGQELPPLEEVRAQIESQLNSEKQSEAITAVIESLRSEATIEVFLEGYGS